MFIKYNMEGVIAMPYTIQDYQNYMRDCVFNYLDTLTPEQVEKFMKGISTDQIVKKMSDAERKRRTHLF
ncbi:Uncharacterized protein dnl_15520 [Desulfonema limicola]|uniref:Uncharacterized protein n=2 Tax=Desulfonema limicola TaxID=45656 RepID=A0A975B5R8_9BACT|nr:Uncharacterized protein dnl_15520 [Desulfonema limicola]